MAVLENCEPKRVFHYFEEICKIPHGSGNTKQISDYLVQFAKDHDLKYVQDEMNNVVIYKPGTAGYENAPVVIIQGHMDMVCEKRPDVEHDFTKDGLNLSVEGDYVSANGTTLGGDDGIAVAYGLALLESDTIAHPPLEVFITVDEEIGLLGAVGFDCSVLKGRRFINLDSEAEGSLWISCAGGLSGVSHIPVTRLDAEGEKLTVKISGLMGGHSGAEIDKNRANANSLLGKFLHGLDEKTDFELISVQGGQKDNAITREATAEILVLEENTDAVSFTELPFLILIAGVRYTLVAGSVTVILQAAFKPFFVVAVIVAVPAFFAVTFPFASTFTTEDLEDFHFTALSVQSFGVTVAFKVYVFPFFRLSFVLFNLIFAACT